MVPDMSLVVPGMFLMVPDMLMMVPDMLMMVHVTEDSQVLVYYRTAGVQLQLFLSCSATDLVQKFITKSGRF